MSVSRWLLFAALSLIGLGMLTGIAAALFPGQWIPDQVVATIFIWIVLNSTGIFGSLDNILKDILGDPEFSVAKQFSLGQVALFSFIVAILNIVVGTALGAIASMLYNFSVRLTGGLLVGFTNN